MNIRAVGPVMYPVIDLKATGINIIKMRKAAGLTVRDLQLMLGFSSSQAIYKWQSGESLPSIDNLVILAAIFGVALEDILVINGCGAGEVIAMEGAC